MGEETAAAHRRRNKVVRDALIPFKLTFLMTLFFCNPSF